MSARCPASVIGGAGSGVGKTSLTLGLAAALKQRGLRVQTFKVGPDFLDPTYLALASGRTCYNLDGWMAGRDYVERLFARATADADIALIEGVMGLFDGASATSLEGSTAEIATWLDAPVLLAINAHGVARSVAAEVKGFATFEPAVRIAGVIANQIGGQRHRRMLGEALATAQLPPLVGAMPRGALPALPSRHLGLVTADAEVLPEETIERLAAACVEHLDLDGIVKMGDCSRRREEAVDVARHSNVETGGCDTLPQPTISTLECRATTGSKHFRLGVAWDRAFHFYYPDNLEALAAGGAEIVKFSPIADRALPPDLGAICLGGGYPEVHAEALSANQPMREAIAAFAASGRAVYAECGGLMYLGRTVRALDGRVWPMAGVIPIETAMLERLRALGYVEVELAADSLWGRAGQALRGHEFHYSEIRNDDSAAQGWQKPYRVAHRRGGSAADGFQKGNIVASYVHLHFASRPEAVRHFIEESL